MNYKDKIFLQSMLTLLIIAAATLLSYIIKNLGFSDTNIVVIYILSVLIVSYFTKGYFYGIAASVLCMFSFNFFFTAPIHSFNVYNKSYVLTLIVMLIASILTSTLTSKIIHSSKTANSNKKQFQTLFKVSSSLAKASSISDVANISLQCISILFDCEATFLTSIDNITYRYDIMREKRFISSQVISKEQIELLLESKTIYYIRNQVNQYGILCLPLDFDINEEKKAFINSICNQIFIALERERLSREKESVKNEVEREKFKSNLLRAISHDLRGPLSSISGASEILLYNIKDSENLGFAKDIHDSSIWLTQMVENILSLTKVQEGSLNINKKPEAIEEIIGVVLQYFSKCTTTNKIVVDIPNDIILVPMDGKLICQVLINLIDNAIKHSNPTDEITIKAFVDKKQVWFCVIDNGTGINPQNLSKIFDLFYIAEDLPSDTKHRGNGLGLAICKAIVLAHGGKIIAENNLEKGATIRFSLPLKEDSN
ncbi:DUF4118 domain-containing protein [Paludicola sp. MB14-C6]|uniref:DUF4118 domain-containing protein n=1 Tax=Paludihabitans sp. MB14-C6 TaxID=3070656 RepID=UPI0027DD1BDA|nr:DUF4118 domain-containing protein [Paludicola sp. MB14-C6]WMJ22991.1 DUF4118 domain-containing protein [Paludicola sp. MB14-C6]